MRKYFLFFFFFSFTFLPLFSIETIITPTMGYTNYFLRTIYKNKKNNTYLHAISFGLDLMFIWDKTDFTFFANNHLSFIDETQVSGDVDFIKVKGASVIEGFIWDISLLAGYTFDLEDIKLRLGVGTGFFHGAKPKSNEIQTALGSVFAFYLDYFFNHNWGISFGIEDGFYGSVRKKKSNEKAIFFNRVQAKLGLAIRILGIEN
jgi:hypothetical protein